MVALPATAWHLGVHPTKDVVYVPTQRCIPQDGDFTEYAIAQFKNYLFEIDAADARVLRHLAIPKDMPGALTSDVVVTEDEVIYNVCASGVLARVIGERLSRRSIDEARVPALAVVIAEAQLGVLMAWLAGDFEARPERLAEVFVDIARATIGA